MKISKSLPKHFLSIILTFLAILLFIKCEDTFEEEIDLQNTTLDEQIIPWNDLLLQLDLGSEMAFVQNGESIQDAIDLALPGDVIYIEPGNYQGKISNNKTDIKLIGISLLPGDLTINNSKESNIDILKLYDQNNIDKFQKKSKNRAKRRSIRNFSRKELGRGIAHYKFDLQAGKGEFDIVTIHRVVRESTPFRPIPTKGHVFMVHGANQDFDAIFLTAGAEVIDAKTSSPFYLASKNIDVWAIDMGWTKVPSKGITDFSFMKDWGIEKDIDHLLKAMRIARVARLFSRQGCSGLNLLGFSYGVTIVYGAANRETQQNNWMKHNIKGIIPVDNSFKTNLSNCTEVDEFKNMISNGQFYNPWLDQFPVMGGLALNRPDAYDMHPDLTNSQFMEFVGSQGFFAGENGKFLYTDPIRFFHLATNLSVRMPTKIFLDMASVKCDTEDVTFDDHLEEISIPILYIGANNDIGSYTPSLTASTDITIQVVDGYGHADPWMAYDADTQVWDQLRGWITTHK
ncbi:MAG: hypothetical protein GQ552_08005 [Flavobacteriaceae bacterium]|nr:hypothetical protein [Flavobacteriaceae bacterium]